MARNQTLSGKPTMPSAWSAQVHGKVRPLDYPGRRLMRTWAATRDEEARLARLDGEKPDHHPLFGVIIISGLLGILFLALAAFAIMNGGFS